VTSTDAQELSKELREQIAAIAPDFVHHDYGCDTQHGGSRCECDVPWQIERLKQLGERIAALAIREERRRLTDLDRRPSHVAYKRIK
jgi:hypothetical protein